MLPGRIKMLESVCLPVVASATQEGGVGMLL